MQTIKAQVKFKKNKCIFTIFGKTFTLEERNTAELYESYNEIHQRFRDMDYTCFLQIESVNGTSQTAIVNKDSVDLMLARLIRARRVNKSNAYKKVIMLPNNTKVNSTR